MQSQNKFKFPAFFALAFAGAAFLAASHAGATGTQLLANPSFEQNSGRSIPVGWSLFLPPEPGNTHTNDYWIQGAPPVPVDGTLYWKEWGMGYFPSPTNNVAGIYQILGSAPGSIYQASGWFYTSSADGGGLGGGPGAPDEAWIDVSFLDANNHALALYTSTPFSASTGMDSWFQFDVTNACDLSSPVATGDPYFTNYAVTGAVTQLVAPAGTVHVRYRYCYLQAAGDGGSCYFDSASLIQYSGLAAPVISNIFPINMIFVAPSNGLSFDVTSPSGSTINNNAIHVTLNGLDISANLTITGSSSNKAVLYSGLQSNTIYNASITVTDVFNLASSANTYFETTWVGIPPILYLWEAEDFDFTNGMYIDYPDLCNADGDPNCYWDKVGTEGVDEFCQGENVSHLYRDFDFMNINISGDLLRKNLYFADRTDYEINPFDSGEWLNYTRDFTNGTYWIIARLATDVNISGFLTLSEITSDGTTNELGTFKITDGLGWTTFSNVFLLDTNGNRVNVPLNGKTTLHVVSGGNLLPNFFALVQATTDLPILSGLYPDGNHPYEYTNALSFNVSTVGATFPAGDIRVTLDGFDVTSDLVITGSGSNETVVYPKLLLNAPHTAVITVTNSLGHGLSVDDSFDTFGTNNYTVEASDFDYGGGQFLPIVTNNYNYPNWYPDAYQGLAATTNIDFQHTTIGGEQYPYRPDGIPQQVGADYPNPVFLTYGGIEYDLGDFGIGDWANYTGNYPTGKFYIYMRTAGLGSNSMYLEQVVSGAGTANQTVKKLGDWNGVGASDVTYSWEPLTDDGSVAPLAISLGGLETLRITTTTGFCYPNYFMLVPAGGVGITATRQGANASISFPTQSGIVYRVFYRTDLGTGSWNLQTSVLGNGSAESVSVPAGAGARFYMVTAP